MNGHIQDTIGKLLELHSLEERLDFFKEQDKDTAGMEASISSLRTRIAANVLTRHDRLRAQGKRSVAECRGGVCSGCHMKAAISLVPLLMRQDTLHACEHCGRYLYVSEKQEVQPVAVPVPAKKRKVRAARSKEHAPVLVS